MAAAGLHHDLTGRRSKGRRGDKETPPFPATSKLADYNLASSNSSAACIALRQVYQARTDFAAIEPDLEVIQRQLARLPTRREPAGTALGIIFATMMLTTLSCCSLCASG